MAPIRAAESRLRRSQSDELVGSFPYLFSPSQPYTTPVFFFVPNTLSPRPIGITSPAQCTSTIGSRPIFPRASRSLEPRAVFCGRSQASADREAYHSASNGYPMNPFPPWLNCLYFVVCVGCFGARVCRRCPQHQRRDELLGKLSRRPEEMEYGSSNHG